MTGRYAVLLHDTPDGPVHYDLLVEKKTSLGAWRLTAPPEEIPPEGLRITRIPDHRKVYLDYEGEIRGGRGSVSRHSGGRFSREGERLILTGGPSQGVYIIESGRMRPAGKDSG